MFAVKSSDRSKYYKYLARLNYEVALAADHKIGIYRGYEISAPPPVMTLCAHAIELSLKAFLLDHGLNEAEVKKFKHDLYTCWLKCKEIDPDLPTIDENVLLIISDLLKSGRLRYGDASKIGKTPVFGPLQLLVESCLNLCGAP